MEAHAPCKFWRETCQRPAAPHLLQDDPDLLQAGNLVRQASDGIDAVAERGQPSGDIGLDERLRCGHSRVYNDAAAIAKLLDRWLKR